MFTVICSRHLPHNMLTYFFPWPCLGSMREFVSALKITDEAAALVQLSARMVMPRGEARSDYEIVFDLACRPGMADDFFGGNIEAGWNYMLERLGLTATTRSS
jgi:hypothetical protein